MKRFVYLTLLLFCACSKSPVKNEDVIAIVKKNDQKLYPPKPGDWRYQHEEKSQSFDQYKLADPTTITPTRKYIYLLPIGSFSNEQRAIIKSTADYLSLYFCLKTLILDQQPDKQIPLSARRKKEVVGEQLLASYIIDTVLAKKIPEDAFAVMAITEKDLYPAPEWNYVFGMASYSKRVGVSSLYRYSGDLRDSTRYNLCLERFIKTCSHEIGHMFSMAHCQNAVCNMNGVNNMQEADPIPNRLCAECLSKLSWNLKFNNKARLIALTDYFKLHNLKNDYRFMQKDLNALN